MKRIMLVAVMLVVAFSLATEASAQQLVKKRIGLYEENGIATVSEASTTLAVDLVVECEKIVVGPYARYAQKIFGERAALVDNTIYRVVDAVVSVAEGDVPSVELPDEGVSCTTYMGSDDSFAILLPNRLSREELSADEAAIDAAEQIYALRRARIDLVTGEMGDAVYGAGLETALREIDRLEQEYLELFFGKRSVTTSVERIYVPMSSETTNYVLARFSTENGLTEVDDLSGEIVMLSVTPSDMKYPEDTKKGKGKLLFRYANNAHVTVVVARDAVSSTILPIFEYGKSISYAAPHNKVVWTKPVE